MKDNHQYEGTFTENFKNIFTKQCNLVPAQVEQPAFYRIHFFTSKCTKNLQTH